MDYRIEKKEAFDVVLMKKFFPKAHEITTREIAKFWGDCQADRTIPTVCKYIHKPNIFDSCIIGVSFDATNATQNSDFPTASACIMFICGGKKSIRDSTL